MDASVSATEPNHPPVIGLTGSIGAGKSSVARILAELGCIVSDSDQLARAAFDDPEVRGEMVRWWGPAIETSSGAIDRHAIASIVFARPSASREDRIAAERERMRLEGLIHPWIHTRRKAHFAAARQAGANHPIACVIDAPLLLESHLQGECDTILFVDAPFATRFERLMTHRGWSRDELTRRESAQMPLDQKRKFADHVLINDGDLQSLRAQVARLLSHIIERTQRA
ncbi:MAG: dephospho-CoA kinase [Phycisphaerales bacterium]|nr:dephospho-CoA kinase [Phycisphaerales bacterium]